MPKRKRSDAAKRGWKKLRLSRKHTGEIKRRKLWDDQSMISAMTAVTSNEMGVNEAAAQHNVPPTTLKNRLSGRVKHGTKPGPRGYLTTEEEEELSEFLIDCCKMGNGKTKKEIIQTVKRLVEKKRSKEGLPLVKFNGEGWWSRFMKRHPELSLRSSDPLSHCRSSAVSQPALDHYFGLLKKTLEVNGLMDKPNSIYNMDESGMPLDHRQPKRVAPRGIKKVHGPSSGNKTQITILACANAVGTMLPPMVIFKGERLNYEWTKGEVPNTEYGMSPQGWTDHELFYEWLNKLFIKNIPPLRPVLLLLDGHSSHFSLEAIKFAAENEIILFCLPPHTTHVAQPLDVSFFAPLKRHWARMCHEYTTEHPGRAVTKFQFSSLFNKAWFISIQPSTIMSGYRKVGVYPFDPTAIKPYESSNITALNPNECITESTAQDKFESGLEQKDPVPSAASLSEDQVKLFQRRFDNGYDIYDDPVYVEWLRQQHPDVLPENLLLTSTSTIDLSLTSTSVEKDLSLSNSSTVDENQTTDPNDDSTNAATVSGSVMAANGIAEQSVSKCYSLSASLANTRKFVTELQVILDEQKVPLKKGNNAKSIARVLNSAESLALLIEKERKKKEEEEQKAKRKEEREKKRREKEEEKKKKAELRKKKEEEKLKQKSKKSGNKSHKIPPAAAKPSSDSEVEADDDEYGVQNREISNNECAVCFGLYQDDLSTTGKLMREWVECTNQRCKKWMHSQCLQDDNGLYVCGVCNCKFS